MCVCVFTLEVEGSGLAVEALHLSDSIQAFSQRQLIKHGDAQGRVHPQRCHWFSKHRGGDIFTMTKRHLEMLKKTTTTKIHE